MNTTTQVCMYVLGAKAESLTASFKSALNSKIGTRPYYVYIQHLIVPMLTMSDEVAKSETKSFISEGVGWGGGGGDHTFIKFIGRYSCSPAVHRPVPFHCPSGPGYWYTCISK